MMSPSVLIIDDEIPVQNSIMKALKREGYDFFTANDGQEGMKVLNEKKPDVVILDLKMPEVDGLNFLRKISDIALYKHSIMVLSGYGEEHEVKECYDMGIRFFMKKPFNVFELRGTVKNMILVQQHKLNLEKNLEKAVSSLKGEVKSHKITAKKLREKNKILRSIKANLEIEIQRVVDELREKDILLIKQSHFSAMGKAISHIAHYWRQPLASVSAIIQNIEDMYDYDELNEEMLKKNIKDALAIMKKCSSTIDEFRTLFIQERQDIKLDLSSKLKEIAEFIKKTFPSIKLILNLNSNHECYIKGDPSGFSRNILRFIDNSRQAFIERKIDNPMINISLYHYDNEYVINIIDNAGGIPEDIIDHIFEPYFTTRDVGLGEGLGLFLAKSEFVISLGGKIDVRNLENGTEFSITLPILK